MRVLSLFSGIGAHDLGLEWAGFEIVGQVEIDEFCQKILKKHFPKAKRWTDICAVTANDIRRRCGRIDLITGGFPCQDISTAGKQKGLVEGERSGLWREMWRLIRDLRPDWLLLENVPALRTKGGDNILAALEDSGTPAGRSWWVLSMPALPTKDGESGSWHTPRAIYGEHPGMDCEKHLTGQAKNWATPRVNDEKGSAYQRDPKGKTWLTLTGQAQMWPTPTASLEEPSQMKPGVPWWLQSRSSRNLKAMAYQWATPKMRDALRGGGVK
jgi:hypothetical protein